MATSKLDETLDFIELFTYLSGSWIVPESFYRWTAISLICACVEDRVWLDEIDDSPLKLNMWIFLVALGGVGKDRSIARAQALLRPEDPLAIIDGKLTVPGLYDFLSRNQAASGRGSAPVYIISSDAWESLPIGPEAQEFITRALNLYGGRERICRDITRTSGDKSIRNPLVNWLLGCTPSWFPKAIDPEMFNSGMAGRMAFIIGKMVVDNYHKRKPTRRHDHDIVWDFLRKRVETYQIVEGPVVFDSTAETAYEQWLIQQQHRLQTTRMSEVDEQLMSRTRTTLLKLTAIFTLSSWQGGLLIADLRAFERATKALQEITDGALRVSELAYTTEDTAPFERVREKLRDCGAMWRRDLLAFAMSRGVRDKSHFDAIMSTLKEMGVVREERVRPQRGGRWPIRFVWQKRKLYLTEEDFDDENATEESASAGETEESGEESEQ